MRLWKPTLAGLAAAAAAAVMAPAALAASTPALSPLTQFNGTTQLPAGSATPAGSTSDLGLDLTFTNTTTGGTTDTPDDLTINLPGGLLTNTSIKAGDGSQCINDAPTGQPDTGCQIGSGTVTATAGGIIPVSVVVGYYLVAPPSGSPGDLAGLEVYDSQDPSIAGVPSTPLGQLGNVGDITIRSSDAGATIKLTGLPDTAANPLLIPPTLPLAVSEINSTFDNLRFPTTCPATPQTVTVTSTSYAGDTESVTPAPLLVNGCSALAYNPQFSASATRDTADKGVSVSTDITQTASEAPNQNVSLSFPSTMFGANLQTLPNLCANPASGSCKAVGSVTAASPLYPKPLNGAAYLSGNASGPTLVLKFPSPFPLTLTGQVNLNTNTASFTGLPDIPLSDLNVTLTGGPSSLFVATCQASSGNATAALAGQNGATKTLTAPISYTGCPADNPPKGTLTGSGSGSGSGTGGGSSAGGGGSTAVAPTATAKLVSPTASGLAKGRPSLTFKVAAGKKAAKLTRLTVKLPSGLSFRAHAKGKRKAVTGITLQGTASQSATLTGKKLVIVFKTGSRKVTVRLGPKALKESKALRAKAQKKALKSLVLRVTARNAKHKSKALKAKITKLNLG